MWVYGLLLQKDKEAMILPIEDPTIAVLVDCETIGQYTGLKDCNGTETYEGDILSTGREEPFHKLVYWEEEEATYRLENLNLGILKEGGHLTKEYIIDVSLCVIGNKYDNPELLSGE